MLQDLKRSTTDKKKRELQGRVGQAERKIERHKGLVREYEIVATGREVRLGWLEKEGECRT